MLTAYDELLDATIRQLEDLKSRGTRHVPVSAETLRKLSLPPALSVPQQAAQSSRASNVELTKAVGPSKHDSRPLASPSPGGEGRGEGELIPAEARGSNQSGFQSVIRNPQPAAPEPRVGGSAIEKSAAFAALRERVLACVKCSHLASSRKNVVFGVGNIEAQLMFVGEAPGADEDAQAEPFVGRAGELLTKIIQAMGLQRSDVYIANILKCRPDTPGQSAGNRKPTPDEMATCIPYLHEQIDLIGPRVIVALGATAIEGLLGKTQGIMKMRGTWKTYRGTPLMPTFHPAYLLRNQAMSEKRKVWEDMLSVMEKLEMPISAKQQNFFTKG
jgi:uracil-DNA glycosylase family 4